VLFLTAKLTNNSSETLYRVSATTESDYFLYNEREFLFGKIGPGESIERKIESIIYPSSATRSDLFTAQVQVPGLDGPVASVDHEVELKGEEFPQFTYSLTLLDAKTKTPLTHLSPGVDAIITAKLENIGNRAMKKGVAILRKEPGEKEIYLKEGRIDIENFGPNQTREIDFLFEVREDSELEEYELEFAIADSHYPAGVSRKFVVLGKAGTEGKDGIRNGHVFRQPVIQVTTSETKNGKSAGESEKTNVITDHDTIFLSSNVTDSNPFKAWITTTPVSMDSRTQPDKIFFAKSESTERPLQLLTPVPLDIGQNLITVVAKNEDGLIRRKILFVRRKPVKTVSSEKPNAPEATNPPSKK